MISQKKGVQVHIASLNTDRPLKGVLAYAMSKAGLATMTRGLALEWGQHGIRVNGIAPGFILTDLSKKLWAQPHMQAWNEQNCPLQRLGVVEDLVGACVYLASDASAFMTGQTLFVDGGMTAGYSWPIEL
jgi:NAD(P)-dependent dehydrogenase (short-subunit alcohol dehydrogenase family)